MSAFIALIILIFQPELIKAQPQAPDSLWSSISWWDNEKCYAIEQTPDGGYVFAGHTSIPIGQGSWDFKLVKTDPAGIPNWITTYSTGNLDYCYDMEPAADGGYILAGYTGSFILSYNFMLVKTNSDGDSIWCREYGGPNAEYCYAVQQTTDGGYILGGKTASFGAGYYDFWLVKTDANGDSVWSRTFGDTGHDACHSVKQTSDGGYILAGRYGVPGAADDDFMLIKTDDAGNMMWSQTYGGNSYDYCMSVIECSQGGYVLAGYTMSYGVSSHDYWLIKTDALGNPEWDHTYGGGGIDKCQKVMELEDGGFLLGGYSESFGAGEYDYWLVRTGVSGEMLWNKTFGGDQIDECNDFLQTDDGGFVLAGHSRSYGGIQNTNLLIGTTEEGNPDNLSVLATPVNPPIIIPANGGSFGFNLTIENSGQASLNMQFWTKITLPGGNEHGPILGPVEASMPGSFMLLREKNQNVPGIAPAGDYTYTACIGVYPDIIWNEDNFAFSKSAGTFSPNPVSNWDCTEGFCEGSIMLEPDKSALLSAYPNPFNSSLRLEYTLPASGRVRLMLYDIRGRIAAELFDGWKSEGNNDLNYRADGLASGIYFVRLESGPLMRTEKIIYLK